MKILLLGANGYLGSKIANSLSDKHIFYCVIRDVKNLRLLQQNDNVVLIPCSYDRINEVAA